MANENVVIFGMDKDEVYEHYARHDYYSRAVYENNPVIRRVVDTFVNGTIPNAQSEGTEIYEASSPTTMSTSSWKTSLLM